VRHFNSDVILPNVVILLNAVFENAEMLSTVDGKKD